MARSRTASTEREIGRELDVLKSQLSQLTELVEQYGEKKGEEIAASLSGKAREFLEQARNTSTRLAEDLTERLGESGGAMARQARDLAADELERVESAVAERPFTALICAVGAGVALGWLAGRR